MLKVLLDLALERGDLTKVEEVSGADIIIYHSSARTGCSEDLPCIRELLSLWALLNVAGPRLQQYGIAQGVHVV